MEEPIVFDANTGGTPFFQYKQSEWVCYMFGGDGNNGFVWRPAKNKHPNWFWRKMQYLLFGNKWVKECE